MNQGLTTKARFSAKTTGLTLIHSADIDKASLRTDETKKGIKMMSKTEIEMGISVLGVKSRQLPLYVPMLLSGKPRLGQFHLHQIGK